MKIEGIKGLSKSRPAAGGRVRLAPSDAVEPQDGFAPGQLIGTRSKPVAQTLSVAPPRPIREIQLPSQPEPLSREVCSNARVLASMVAIPELGLEESTVERLRQRPEWFGVLAGVLPAVSVSGRERSLISDLHLLSHYQSITTQQDLRVIPDPLREGRWLLCNGDLLAREFPESRLSLDEPGEAPRFDQDRWSADLAARVEEYSEEHRAEAVAALCQLHRPGQGRWPGPRTPARVQWIGYVGSEHQLQRFERVVQDWSDNLKHFGHHTTPLIYCDDSPEPFATRIRQMLEAQSAATGLPLQYVGSEEKQALAANLRHRLEALNPVDREAVVDLFVARGPTQNRNFSLQLLGPSGGLQLDHDMTAEVLVTPPIQVRERFGQSQDWRKIPQTGSSEPVALRYDLLQTLEKAPGDRLSSLRFCGSEDMDLRHLVGAPPAKLRHRHWFGPENRDYADAKYVDHRYGTPMGGSLRSPMNVPKGWDSSSLLAPQVRDGDLAVGQTAYLVGNQRPNELLQYVHHRDQAGGRWGGGVLLYQFKTFEMVSTALSQWVQPPGQGPEAVGRAVLEALDTGEFPSLRWEQEEWSCRYFEEYRQEHLQELQGHLDSLGTDREAEHLETWKGSAEADQCRQEWSLLKSRLEKELTDFRQRFPRNAKGKLEVGRIEKELQAAARPILRGYALALVHSQDIQAAFQDLRHTRIENR